jgi:O-antigen/teichoic acid export membrane protein
VTPTLKRLTTRGRALAQRLKPQSASNRNVLKLAGGTAGSQVISVAAAPILTRLYGPESFGVLATFASILALLNVVSSLRYELAIAVPEDDDEAVALVWLCFALVAISTGLTALGVLLFGDQLVVWLKEPALKPLLWLLPVGVLLSGVYQPLSYWAIRRKQFGLLAQTKFRQSIFGVATNLASAPLGTIGLLMGQIVSQSAGAAAIFRHSAAELLRSAPGSAIYLLKTLRKYSHFGIYSSPAGLINVLANTAPYLLFSSLFGSFYVGQLLVAQRILLAPASLISNSIGQVFLQKASEAHRQHVAQKAFKEATQKLASLLAPSIVFLVLLAYFFSSFIFGRNWAEIGIISLSLTPLLVAKTVVSPVGQILFALGKTRLQLFAHIVFITVSLLPFTFFGSYSLPFWMAVLAWSIFNAFGYILFWLLCLMGSQKSTL